MTDGSRADRLAPAGHTEAERPVINDLCFLVVSIDTRARQGASALERFALWAWMAAFLASAGRVLMAVA
jgi:hypothetical protein